MNQAAKKLVDEIDALPDRDRSELVAELVRVWPWVPTICPTTTTLLRLPTACSSSSIVRSNLNEIAQRGEVWLVDLGMAAKLRPDQLDGPDAARACENRIVERARSGFRASHRSTS